MRVGWNPYYKPTLGATIAWGHPLTRELKACWLCNEMTGGKLTDLVRNVQLVQQSSPTWAIKGDRQGLLTDATSEGAEITTPGDLRLSLPITIVWRGVDLGGVVGGNADVCGASYDNADSNPWVAYAISRNDSNNEWRIASNTAGTYYELDSNVADSADTNRDIVAVFDSNRTEVYVDGVSQNSSATARSSPNYDSTSLFAIGCRTSVSVDLNALTEMCLVYNRAFSDEDVKFLYDQPYCFIRTPKPRPWYLYSEAVAAQTMPIISSDDIHNAIFHGLVIQG